MGTQHLIGSGGLQLLTSEFAKSGGPGKGGRTKESPHSLLLGGILHFLQEETSSCRDSLLACKDAQAVTAEAFQEWRETRTEKEVGGLCLDKQLMMAFGLLILQLSS